MNATSTPTRRPAFPSARTPLPASMLLRALLRFDASTCAALGLSLVAANGFAARLTGLPPGALFEAGVALLVFAVVIGWIAVRKASSRLAVLAIVDANVLWAIGSVAIGCFGIESATPIGRFLVLGQGVAVGALAAIEFWALRRGLARA